MYDKIIQPSTIIGARATDLALTASGDAVRSFHPRMKREYSNKQGYYLGLVHYYIKIHGYLPAEVGIQRYFEVTTPTVHQMILTLEKRGLIHRVPGQPRTVRALLPPEELPDLA